MNLRTLLEAVSPTRTAALLEARKKKKVNYHKEWKKHKKRGWVEVPTGTMPSHGQRAIRTGSEQLGTLAGTGLGLAANSIKRFSKTPDWKRAVVGAGAGYLAGKIGGKVLSGKNKYKTALKVKFKKKKSYIDWRKNDRGEVTESESGQYANKPLVREEKYKNFATPQNQANRANAPRTKPAISPTTAAWQGARAARGNPKAKKLVNWGQSVINTAKKATTKTSLRSPKDAFGRSKKGNIMSAFGKGIVDRAISKRRCKAYGKRGNSVIRMMQSLIPSRSSMNLHDKMRKSMEQKDHFQKRTYSMTR